MEIPKLVSIAQPNIMEWKCDKSDNFSYYYYKDPGNNKEAALIIWWLKIIELAQAAENWNAIIADLWIDNTGRIIGHVQDKKDAIGMDRRFRVSLTFEDFAHKLYNINNDEYDEYGETLIDMIDECEELLSTTIKDEKVVEKMKKLYSQNPFQIFHAQQGQCNLRRNEIKFQ